LKRIGILQPSYLPWLGYFDQIDRVDEFVILDDVQFDKHGWRNRNRIKTAAGVKWITVPVRHSGRHGQSVRETEIADDPTWVRKQIRTLEQAYAKAPYRDAYLPAIEAVLAEKHRLLHELDIALLMLVVSWLGIETKFHLASQLDLEGDPEVISDINGRLVTMCKHLGGSYYLSGAAAASYLAQQDFNAVGIQVELQAYAHPTYPQLHGPFVSHLSIVDLLFNCGPESLHLIRSGQPTARQHENA
jgi:hypothetical protein